MTGSVGDWRMRSLMEEGLDLAGETRLSAYKTPVVPTMLILPQPSAPNRHKPHPVLQHIIIMVITTL